MSDHPSKLQNVQLPAEPGDSLPSGVVEVNSFAGLDGNSDLVPSAAKEGVERRACDCENYTVDGCGISCLLLPQDCFFIQLKENVYCRLAQRNLP